MEVDHQNDCFQFKNKGFPGGPTSTLINTVQNNGSVKGESVISGHWDFSTIRRDSCAFGSGQYVQFTSLTATCS
jgi:hypothetical protein